MVCWLLIQFNLEFYKYKPQIGQRDKERWRWLENVWKPTDKQINIITLRDVCTVLWRVFRTVEDAWNGGGCSVLRWILPVHLKIFSTSRDIISIVEVVQCYGGYHQYYGGILSLHWEISISTINILTVEGYHLQTSAVLSVSLHSTDIIPDSEDFPSPYRIEHPPNTENQDNKLAQ